MKGPDWRKCSHNRWDNVDKNKVKNKQNNSIINLIKMGSLRHPRGSPPGFPKPLGRGGGDEDKEIKNKVRNKQNEIILLLQ